MTALEIERLADHFKNYTAGPGFDVLRLVKQHQEKCDEITELRESVSRLNRRATQAEGAVLEKAADVHQRSIGRGLANVAASTWHRRCEEAERRGERLSGDLSELRHAVGHVFACDRGTKLCEDCKRLLSTAMNRKP